MNSKGFTLTELIVTVALIGIISMIAFPAISKLKTDNENEKYKAYEKVMRHGAELYVDSKKKDLWGSNEGGLKRINYTELHNLGLVEPYEENGITCDKSYVCVKKTSYGIISYDAVVICEKNDNPVYNTNDRLGKENKPSISCP